MSGLAVAKQRFADAGLAFPAIPDALAIKLRERTAWLFSTRELTVSPYDLAHYVQERDRTREEYAVLAHTGHGANSYAIQYYLVYGPLRMFLHLGWGGVYMNAAAAATQIGQCFALADSIVPAAMNVWTRGDGECMTIVGSDFYGSHWSTPRQSHQQHGKAKGPAEVLVEVLQWLTNPPPNAGFNATGAGNGRTSSL